MRFITLVRGDENQGTPPPELFEAIAEFGTEATRAGTLLSTGGLLPSSAGTRIRLSDGKLTVTDGPFTEAKEVIGGYAFFEVESKEEMVKIATRFMELHAEHWKGWEGETEIRRAEEVPDFSAGN